MKLALNQTRNQTLDQVLDHARRRWLVTGAGAALGTCLFRNALADMSEADRAIRDFSAGLVPHVSGLLSLTTPDIAENGNNVPIVIAVDSPMTLADHVQSVMIVAPNNPNPEVATFHFSPASGKAVASTRIRLAHSQSVTALARISTGKLYRVSNPVRVMIGGCGA